ncbi:MAG: nitrate reductase cytochrome c-type subunit [Helicobacter sp.]|uniref:nitrate reductase cytochrome c-type subunit n=1 Tax=Helicobacter sp. TaxID=218 RepID=UPI0025BA5403|nr:nitrate reductase cytochrome c-type subunit [Helicobacter sp.]MCH5313960.1 nitrate reductase cytochrome c-type subunit [Helicobacter sp.]
MKKYAQGLMIGLLGLAFFACSDSQESTQSQQSSASTESKEMLKDSEIGIRKVDLQDEKDVKLLEYKYNEANAGESALIERSYENAPPMIPHNIEGMLPITQDENQCLTCHDPAVAKDVGAVSVPTSHTHDLRDEKKKDLGKVSAARFNCVLCHTPQADATPLIANTFTPDFRTQEGKKSSNLLDVLNEGVK